jgi:hypothetical protein
MQRPARPHKVFARQIAQDRSRIVYEHDTSIYQFHSLDASAMLFAVRFIFDQLPRHFTKHAGSPSGTGRRLWPARLWLGEYRRGGRRPP